MDIRLIAATDADLEGAVAAGRFRAPLLHRLAGYEIQVPPLRARKDDFGRLFLHFLRQELETLGESHRLAAGPGRRPWIPPAEPAAPKPRKQYRSPDDVTEQELLNALRAHRWRIQKAAAELGLSRTSLYERIDRSPRIRKGVDLSLREIEACRERCGGNLDAMVERLEVSKRGLQRRMSQLGLARWPPHRPAETSARASDTGPT